MFACPENNTKEVILVALENSFSFCILLNHPVIVARSLFPGNFDNIV